LVTLKYRSGSEAEETLDEADLCRAVALCQPSNLSFADHMHCLIALNRSLCSGAAGPLAMFLVPELNPHDPVSLSAVFAALVLIALAATFPPIIRALRIDPMEALRYE
jgi:hypothetical protein